MFEEVIPGELCGVVGVGVFTKIVVAVVAVTRMEEVGKEAVFKVAMVEVLMGVVISAVAMVPVLVGDVGVDMVWVIGNVIIKVDIGIMFVVQLETDFVDGAGAEDRCILVADVKGLVVTGVEEVDIRELTVFLVVTNDVI